MRSLSTRGWRWHTRRWAALCAKGNLRESSAALRAAIRIDPEQVLGQSDLGRAFCSTIQLEEIVDDCRQPIRLKTDDFGDHEIIAITLVSQSEVSDAIAELSEALRLDPRNGQSQALLGALLLVLERRDEAKTALRTAIWLGTRRADVHVNLSSILADEGNLEQAAAGLREALRLKPDDATSRLRAWGRIVQAKQARSRDRRVPPAHSHETEFSRRPPRARRRIGPPEKTRRGHSRVPRRDRHQAPGHPIVDSDLEPLSRPRTGSTNPFAPTGKQSKSIPALPPLI